MAEVNAVEKQPVTQEYLKKMDAYWRAANYLGAAQWTSSVLSKQ